MKILTKTNLVSCNCRGGLCKMGLTNLHNFDGSWHLYISCPFCRFTRVYEGHFMLCYEENF